MVLSSHLLLELFQKADVVIAEVANIINVISHQRGTVDAEGCYWSALWDGWRVVRLSPAGELLQTIELPVQRPTMIAFGGAGTTIDLSSEKAQAALAAFRDGFGIDAVQIGTGGSIPIVAEFAELNPDAVFLLTAVVDPTSRMHGIDESLELADLHKATLSEALLLQKDIRLDTRDGDGAAEICRIILEIEPSNREASEALSSDGGPARQVTQGKHNFDGQPIWARDGKSLIVSANLSDDWEYQPIDSELYRVNLADGSVTRLTERAGPDRAPALSSDGKQLAWLGFDDKRHPYQAMQLNIGNADASNARSLTSSFDFSIDAISWDGSRGLWLQFDDHGRGCLGWIAASGGAVKRVTCELGGTEIGRPYSGGSFSSVADRLAFTSGTTSSPPNLAVLAGNGKPRMLTDLDANLLDHITLGKVEEITVKSSADGRDIQAWVVTPPGFDPAKKYPLLLEIHGGPFAAYGPWFAPEIQLYAAAGYVVVYANPRGSTSYGTDCTTN